MGQPTKPAEDASGAAPSRGCGFQQKTILTWAKSKFGMGDWLRGQTEHAILAVRGNPIVEMVQDCRGLEIPEVRGIVIDE
jgi:N6-adenosine-specific RNA methylase IME4